MHLVSFDIDGTLVDSKACDDELFARSVREILGVEPKTNWSAYQHVSDSGILNEILEQHVAPDKREKAAKDVQEYFLSSTEKLLTDSPNLIREVPGALKLVETLLKTPKVTVCVATGGWKESASLKLRAIGLHPDKLFMATSSDAMRRVDIMRLAESRASRGCRFAKRTYFGDAAWDQIAARQLGYDFVGVGKAIRNEVVFPDFEDMDAILAHLGV